MRKISPPPGFESRTAQSAASRYIEWATRPILFIWGTNLGYLHVMRLWVLLPLRLFDCSIDYSASSYRGGAGSILAQSVWDLQWTNRQWDRFLSGYFDFALSGSLYQCFTLVLIFLLLLPVVFIPVLHTRPDLLAALTRWTKDEDSNPSKSSALPKIRVHCIEKYFVCFRIWMFKGMYNRIYSHQLLLKVKKILNVQKHTGWVWSVGTPLVWYKSFSAASLSIEIPLTGH